MTLNQLEYFCAVSRLQNITRAAEELFVTQPTISLSIRELEKELHTRLFLHEKNRISLTKEGQAFYEKVLPIVQQCHEVKIEFTSPGEKPLTIGIPPLMSTVFFPRLTNAFQQEYPIRVQLFEYGSNRARDLIDEGKLDVAVVNMDFYNIDHFNNFEMLKDRYVYVVSKTHRYAKEEAITMEMLKDEPIILFNTDSVQNTSVISRFTANHMKPDILMYSSQLGTILNYVRSGTCGAFLYQSIAVNPRDFVEIPLSPEMTGRFGMIWKKGAFLPDRAEKFLRFAKKHLDMFQ